jgi:hypothetical protein
MGVINNLCWKLVNKYPERSRVIYRDGQPYLHRFYITNPRVNGEHKAEEPEQFGLYLHHFYQGDLDTDLHNHPWKWALSFVLTGSYAEEREDGLYIRGGFLRWFNFIPHKRFHRVTLLQQQNKPVWTLFTVGPRVSSWGFKNPETGQFWNWKDYLRSKGERI